MDSTSGLESVLYSRESRLNNANRDGMSGWIPASKKQSGPEQKIKNYYN